MRAALAQERKLGDEERADLEKQAVELGKQLEAGPAEPETLQRAAMVYATLGRPQDAAGVLEKLVEKEPGRAGTWEMLVRACCILGPPVMALAGYSLSFRSCYVSDWQSSDSSLHQAITGSMLEVAQLHKVLLAGRPKQ